MLNGFPEFTSNVLGMYVLYNISRRVILSKETICIITFKS